MPDEQDIGGEIEEIRCLENGAVVIRTHNSEEALEEGDKRARWDTPGYVWSCVKGRMVPKPTDAQVFKQMLDRFGVEYDEDGHIIAIYGGYGGFYAEWIFDKDGKFKRTGSYE